MKQNIDPWEVKEIKDYNKLMKDLGVNNFEKYAITPALGLTILNHHYAIGIILASIANPAIRANVAKLIKFLGSGGGRIPPDGRPNPRNPRERTLNTGRPIAGTEKRANNRESLDDLLNRLKK